MTIEEANTLLKPFDERINATKIPSIEISWAPELSPNSIGSKLGGVAYWPHSIEEYPKDSKGLFLALLAQINWSEVPRIDGYPTSGLSQFFISVTELYGLNFDKPTDATDFRVIYHPNISLNSVPANEIKTLIEKNYAAGNVNLKVFKLGEPLFSLPHDWEKELRMRFKETSMIITLSDYMFDKLFPEITSDLLLMEAYETIHLNTNIGSRIGGYPFFTQDDPRRYQSELKGYTKLLLQIDSDEKGDVMWGDAGVGNFFITPGQLSALNFSKVLFNWDCS